MLRSIAVIHIYSSFIICLKFSVSIFRKVKYKIFSKFCEGSERTTKRKQYGKNDNLNYDKIFKFDCKLNTLIINNFTYQVQFDYN